MIRHVGFGDQNGAGDSSQRGVREDPVAGGEQKRSLVLVAIAGVDDADLKIIETRERALDLLQRRRSRGRALAANACGCDTLAPSVSR